MGPLSLQSLIQTANASASTVSSLEKKALVEIYDEAVRRDPLSQSLDVKSEDHTLTGAKRQCLNRSNNR